MTQYQDNWLDRLFIHLFASKIARVLEQDTIPSGYSGFVSLSKAVTLGRTSAQQRELIGVVLRSMMPSFVGAGIRRFFRPNPIVCELNAWFACLLFPWLVGPLEVKAVEIAGKTQKSGVQIKKCRYLEQSGCAAMCINLCKIPTQEFFTQELGIPLTMTPNFADFSCEMVFGKTPLPPEEDEALRHSCLMLTCDSAISASRCPRI